MKKQRAIGILKNQIDKLNKIKEGNTTIWTNSTNTYLERFFGDLSSQSNFFKYSYWNTGNKINTNTFDEQKEKGVEFLKECIELIDNLGLYKPPKENFLSRLPNGWILPIIGSLMAGSYFVGGFFSEKVYLNNPIEVKKSSPIPSADSVSNKQDSINKQSKK